MHVKLIFHSSLSLTEASKQADSINWDSYVLPLNTFYDFIIKHNNDKLSKYIYTILLFINKQALYKPVVGLLSALILFDSILMWGWWIYWLLPFYLATKLLKKIKENGQMQLVGHHNLTSVVSALWLTLTPDLKSSY